LSFIEDSPQILGAVFDFKILDSFTKSGNCCALDGFSVGVVGLYAISFDKFRQRSVENCRENKIVGDNGESGALLARSLLVP